MASPADKLTVACVLRSGGDYGPEYVRRLADGVAANLSLPYRFICLTNMDVPSRASPLRHGWPGWWSKLELFSQFTHGQVLYFDLDTTIQGSLDDIAAHPHRFTMLQDFTKPCLASGMMAWSGDWSALYRIFAKDPKGWARHCNKPRLWGDGGFIEHLIGYRGIDTFQSLHPGQVASRKCSPRHSIEAARVVCWHGTPRPHEAGWKV